MVPRWMKWSRPERVLPEWASEEGERPYHPFAPSGLIAWRHPARERRQYPWGKRFKMVAGVGRHRPVWVTSHFERDVAGKVEDQFRLKIQFDRMVPRHGLWWVLVGWRPILRENSEPSQIQGEAARPPPYELMQFLHEFPEQCRGSVLLEAARSGGKPAHEIRISG